MNIKEMNKRLAAWEVITNSLAAIEEANADMYMGNDYLSMDDMWDAAHDVKSEVAQHIAKNNYDDKWIMKNIYGWGIATMIVDLVSDIREDMDDE